MSDQTNKPVSQETSNSSPVFFRKEASGEYLGITLRFFVGSNIRDTKQIHFGAMIDPEEGEDRLRIRLRRMLAEHVAKAIISDDWSL
jgi:hypothetical protein